MKDEVHILILKYTGKGGDRAINTSERFSAYLAKGERKICLDHWQTDGCGYRSFTAARLAAQPYIDLLGCPVLSATRVETRIFNVVYDEESQP